MIGIWNAYSNLFLYVVGVAMLLVYGLPLIFAPLRWAKAFGWEIQPSTTLTVMLGRSLGILISLVAVFAFVVTRMTEAKPFFFLFILCLIGLNTLLHLYGAIRRVQPKLETYELGLWVILFVLTLVFYPV